MKIFFDGGLRPAGMELAVVIAGQAYIERDLGPGTSMAAEWRALLAAISLAKERALADPILLGDAAAVIAQAQGKVRCPPPHAADLAAFQAIAQSLPRLRLRHIKRTQNLAGIALACERR